MTVDMARLLEVARTDPRLLLVRSPVQQSFRDSGHLRRLVRGGTQTGKTTIGVDEAWNQAETKPGSSGLILCADWPSARDVVGKKMWEMAPKHLIHPDSDYLPNRGWKNKQILLLNGSIIHLRSGESKQVGLSGLTVDWLWFDEPPPQNLFGESLSRVAARQGPVWMTMTPIGRPCGWLQKHIEGDPKTNTPPQEDWEQHVMRLSPEDCPHRTPESIAQQIAGYGPWERAQRVDAAWDGVTVNRMFADYDEDAQDPIIEHRNYQMGLGIDHGEGAGRQAAVLVLWSTKPGIRIHVIDEYVSAKATTPEEDAKAIRAMLARHGFNPNQVDLAYGDINSAGKRSPGTKINDLLSYELNGLRIRTPSKGPGSVEFGVRLINVALRRGHLKVHPSCQSLDHSLRHWTGKKSQHNDLTHTLDALRYLVVPVLQRCYGQSEFDRIRLRRA